MMRSIDFIKPNKNRSARAGIAMLAAAAVAVTGTAFGASQIARSLLLYDETRETPITAGGELDNLPHQMLGGRPYVTTSSYYNEKPNVRPPRLCEMPSNYHSKNMPNTKRAVGYNNRNGYVRKYKPRYGRLTEREQKTAEVAWQYFERFTQPDTGLANSVGNYPSTTLWDTASYVSGLVSAYELCLIEKLEFDNRVFALLKTIRGFELFRGELPNKVYNTKTGAKVDYTNKSGEIGYSALDIGRFLVWMRILKNRYPYFGNTIDSVLIKWDFSKVIGEDGTLVGAHVNKETGETLYSQEGRLGYEEYAAKGFALWGFTPGLAHRAEPYMTASIFGVPIPYDGRDPRIFHSQNYVVTEGYVLDGLEMNFDMPHDDSSDDLLHSDGWRAEFADRIYRVQELRREKTGYLTARSEHNVKGPPYFTYDTIFSDGYAWNTVTPRGDYAPDHAAVSSKAAFGLWALWDTPYTDELFDAIGELYDPEKGMYEGLYERGQGKIDIFTANNNGIILAALLHKVQGKILTPYTGDTEVWFTSYRDWDTRERRNLPDPIAKEDWLPTLRHRVHMENEL